MIWFQNPSGFRMSLDCATSLFYDLVMWNLHFGLGAAVKAAKEEDDSGSWSLNELMDDGICR